MSLYLKNITFVDWQSLAFKKGHLMVSEGTPGKIEFVDAVPDTAIDCKGKLVTRSFVCAHHHIYSALARGMPLPKKAPRNFLEILQNIWWRLDKNLDLDMIAASAKATALDCAKNGVTFVIDHHASPFAVEGSLNTIAKSFDEIGLGHLLCYELSDRDGPKSREQGLAETEDYLKHQQGLVGLHASFTVSKSLLEEAVRLCEEYDSGIHIHVAEDKIDQEECVKSFGHGVGQRLAESGTLNFNKSILVHCIHLENNEKKLLAASRAWVAVNTESNLNNKVGLYNSSKELEAKVLLGTDGMHSDMIRSVQYNYFCDNTAKHPTLMEVYLRLRRVHNYLSLNKFKGDGENNLVILDYNPPTPLTTDNWLGHFFYGLKSEHVNSVISQGRLIMQDKKLLTCDEGEILTTAREQARRLWKRMNN